jgi:8-oxo-dGTP pyrophosphatase MutT (NUDIX family)
MIQAAMRDELSAYLEKNPATENSVALKDLISLGGDLFARGPSLAHVTASAWILNEEGTHALLIEHAKYHKFCPPGGHVDQGETALEACLREVGEEVGLYLLKLLFAGIFDIDIHRIPASEKKNEPEHWHIDVRYAFRASKDEAVKLNLDECLSHKWQPIVELAKLEDQSVSRLALKTMRQIAPTTLSGLGYSPSQMETIRQAMDKPQGLIVIAGTSSSQPLSTIAALCGEAVQKYRVANPPENVGEVAEHFLAGSAMPPRDPSEKFREVVRLAMRSDPQFVMTGEVRDQESTDLVTSLVSSGHLVATSTHAASAIKAATRLRFLGVSPDDLANRDFLSALVYQVKLPQLCPHCAIGLDQFKEEAVDGHSVQLIDRIQCRVEPHLIDSLRFRNEKGCASCVRGTVGFTLAAEVISPDDVMRQCFLEGKDDEALKHYRAQGGQVAIEHAVEKALKGEVELRDVEFMMGPFCTDPASTQD